MERSPYLVEPPAACDASVLLGLTARAGLAATAARFPERFAFVEAGVRLTWAQTSAAVDRLAGALAAAGIGSGDVVGIQLPNGAAYAVAHLATAELGAITLPLHVPYGPAELAQFLSATGARAFIFDGTVDAPAGIRDRLPALGVLVAADCTRVAFALDGAVSARPRGTPEPQTPFAFVPTSGTESLRPKICMHAHDGLLSNARAFVDEAGIDERDALIVGSGFTHLFGLLGLHVALLSGATMLSLRRFEAGAFLRLAEAEGATRAWAVPAQLIDLIAAARRDRYVLQLREVRTAGAPAGAALVADVRAALGAPVTVHWGMSELGGGITTFGSDAAAAPAAIGRPIAGAEARIVRLEDGTDAAPGEVGELWYRRADLFRGYLGEPEQTARAVTPDGWLRTGDLAARDVDGVVHYHGRDKDLVNRGGYKIGTAEIEAHLHALAAIRRCAVVAVPDARLGERACLVAELHPGTALTLADAAALLGARGVAKYKWPEHLVIVDAMPMTATNKIAKSRVRELARERLAGQAVHA